LAPTALERAISLAFSVFCAISSEDLSEWLQEYTLGELWQKNVLGCRPSNEHMPNLVPNGGNGHL
jgi:hypothetical protein